MGDIELQERNNPGYLSLTTEEPNQQEDVVKIEKQNSPKKEESFISVLLRLYQRNTIFISFAKFAFSVIWSLEVNRTWKTCRLPFDAYSDVNSVTCTSACTVGISGDECQVEVRFNQTFDLGRGKSGTYCITDHVSYYFPGGAYVDGNEDYSACRVRFTNETLCSSWLITSFGLMFLNFLHLLYQLICYYAYNDFDPQQVQFLGLPYLANSFWRCSLKKDYLAYFYPRNCFLSILELGVIWFAWVENDANESVECIDLGQDDGYSGSGIRTPTIFAIIVTWMEVYKINYVLFMNHHKDDNDLNWIWKVIYGLPFLFRFDLTILYAVLIAFQGIFCALYIVTVFPWFLWTGGTDDVQVLYDTERTSSKKIKPIKSEQ